MDLGIASVAAITVFAYLVGLFWKTADKVDDKWIPCVCGAVGCILGIVAFLIKIPDFPANDVINAAAVGIVSGLAATGINQIGKQLFVKKNANSISPDADVDESESDGPDEDDSSDNEDGPQ